MHVGIKHSKANDFFILVSFQLHWNWSETGLFIQVTVNNLSMTLPTLLFDCKTECYKRCRPDLCTVCIFKQIISLFLMATACRTHILATANYKLQPLSFQTHTNSVYFKGWLWVSALRLAWACRPEEQWRLYSSSPQFFSLLRMNTTSQKLYGRSSAMNGP